MRIFTERIYWGRFILNVVETVPHGWYPRQHKWEGEGIQLSTIFLPFSVSWLPQMWASSFPLPQPQLPWPMLSPLVVLTAPSNCEAEQTLFPLRCFCGSVVRAMKKATSDSLWINHLIKGLSVTWLYQGWIYKGKQTASAFLVRGSNFQRSPCEQMVV